MGAPGYQPPSNLTIFVRGWTGRCAVCGNNKLTKTWVKVEPRCSQCDFAIERKEGHFVGAVGMNTIFTFGILLFTMIGGSVLAGPDTSTFSLVLLTMAAGLVATVLFFPISKTLWSAIDLMFVALEPGEVDPRYDPTLLVPEDRP